MADKTLANTDNNFQNASTVKVHGNTSRWVCVSKAWCIKEGWMKSTKVMQTIHGCLVQVSTQQGDNIAEALTFVPGATTDDFK